MYQSATIQPRKTAIVKTNNQNQTKAKGTSVKANPAVYAKNVLNPDVPVDNNPTKRKVFHKEKPSNKANSKITVPNNQTLITYRYSDFSSDLLLPNL